MLKKYIRKVVDNYLDSRLDTKAEVDSRLNLVKSYLDSWLEAQKHTCNQLTVTVEQKHKRNKNVIVTCESCGCGIKPIKGKMPTFKKLIEDFENENK